MACFLSRVAPARSRAALFCCIACPWPAWSVGVQIGSRGSLSLLESRGARCRCVCCSPGPTGARARCSVGAFRRAGGAVCSWPYAFLVRCQCRFPFGRQFNQTRPNRPGAAFSHGPWHRAGPRLAPEPSHAGAAPPTNRRCKLRTREPFARSTSMRALAPAGIASRRSRAVSPVGARNTPAGPSAHT